MRRPLTFFLPGLFLVCCGKPETPVVREQPEPAPALIERALQESREIPREEDDIEEPVVPPKVALADALSMEPGPEREKAVAEVAWNAIETDPETAHQAFRHLPSNHPEKIRLIQHYAMTRAEENPEEAMEWAEARETEVEIAAAKSQIALAIAEKDPALAATLVAESGLVGRDLEVAVVQVVQRWAAKSPAEAAAWVATFQPGQARGAGNKVVAEQWLPQNPVAAFEWLSRLQDAELRRETARAMEGVILQQPKETRDAWLEKADAGLRAELEQQREAAMKDVGDNIPPDAAR